METLYYLGGYHLVKPKSLWLEYNGGKMVHTTSNCMNQSLIGSWAYSWGSFRTEELDKTKEDFELNDKDIKRIQAWADENFQSNRLYWTGDFADLETAIEYKQTFFSHLDDVYLYSISLSASDTDRLISQFENEQHNHGPFRLQKTLANKIKEQEDPKEVLVGYDLIGVEFDSHHTFYCHYATQKLIDKVGLTLNESGLFDETSDWQPVRDYISHEGNGFEPVPWYVAKTKMVTLPPQQ